ncbi:MAG: hypothetical protein IIC51_03435, partial [Planctomycetes bacterium]|nr:hypothetical protein [Planctomycetota bacterium]
EGWELSTTAKVAALPVSVPPLRDHLEDIPELAAYFLDKVPGEDGGRAMHVAPDALRILMAHSWPGNVRELENLCRRAATMGTTDRMTADLIGPWLNPISNISTDLGALRDGRMLEDMERHLVERTLARFNGHRAKSAKALGMGVRTLGMKLKQWREEDASQTGVLVGAGTAS